MSDEIPEGFKMTEIGLIPEDWDVVKLGDICSLRNESIKPDSINNPSLIYVGLEHMIPSEINIRQWGSPEDVRSSKNVFYKGDILYGKLRPYLDKAAIAHADGICSTDILVLKTNNRVSNYYIANLIHMKPFIEYAMKTTAGVNHPRTSWSSLSQYKMLLPPLPEQRAIASILSAIQTAKEKTDAVIKATKELKRSLMKHLFTYGPVPIDEAENVPLKETEIGLIPEDWDVVKIGTLLKEVKVKLKNYNTGEDTIPILSMTRHSGLILQQNKFGKRVASEDISGYKIVKRNQIVVGFPMDEGVIYALKRFDVGAVSPVYTVWELCSESVSIDYLDILLRTNQLIRVYISLSSTTVHRRRMVKGNDFENILIQLPPLPIQQQIADILSAVDKKIEAEENKSKALNELFKTMLNNLMTGKIRFNIPKGDDNNGQ